MIKTSHDIRIAVGRTYLTVDRLGPVVGGFIHSLDGGS